jgi:hypothetical protein
MTMMRETKPVFRYLLIVAIAIYMIGVCFTQADLYRRMGDLEHAAMHAARDNGNPADGHAGHD